MAKFGCACPRWTKDTCFLIKNLCFWTKKQGWGGCLAHASGLVMCSWPSRSNTSGEIDLLRGCARRYCITWSVKKHRFSDKKHTFLNKEMRGGKMDLLRGCAWRYCKQIGLLGGCARRYCMRIGAPWPAGCHSPGVLLG